MHHTGNTGPPGSCLNLSYGFVLQRGGTFLDKGLIELTGKLPAGYKEKTLHLLLIEGFPQQPWKPVLGRQVSLLQAMTRIRNTPKTLAHWRSGLEENSQSSIRAGVNSSNVV